MRKYLAFFRLRFSMDLQYRAAAFAGVITQFAWGTMEILMFRAFYQADASRSNQGSGLGLAMVQEIAQLHHGYMKVESVQGKGSCFTFCVPMK